MVDSRSLIHDRLGGADYDGDMVKTIADPLVNACVSRSCTDNKALDELYHAFDNIINYDIDDQTVYGYC